VIRTVLDLGTGFWAPASPQAQTRVAAAAGEGRTKVELAWCCPGAGRGGVRSLRARTSTHMLVPSEQLSQGAGPRGASPAGRSAGWTKGATEEGERGNHRS
jgi:hypothetical protein